MSQMIDLSQVEAKSLGRGHAPAGEYEAELETVSFGTSKDGKPMFSIEAHIVSGEFTGVLFFDNLVVGGDPNNDKTKKALGFAKKKLQDLGEDTSKAFDGEAMARRLTGRRTNVILGVEAQMEKNPATNAYDKPRLITDESGKSVPAMKNNVVCYRPLNGEASRVDGAQAQNPGAAKPSFNPQGAGTGSPPPFAPQ